MAAVLKTLLKRVASHAAVASCAVLMTAGVAYAEAPTEAQLTAGKLLFQKGAVPACAVCHTMQDAGSSGAIGPNLDELRPDLDQVLAVLRDGSGPMPSFQESLTQEQREAVANYVVWATHQ